jgi:hypothetical protein
MRIFEGRLVIFDSVDLRQMSGLCCSRKRSEGSNLSPSAMQSGLQRTTSKIHPHVPQIGSMLRVLLRNRVGENVPKIANLIYRTDFYLLGSLVVRFPTTGAANQFRSEGESSTNAG